MTEYPSHRPCDTETTWHKISHNKYYEKWGTIDKIKHEPRMLQSRIQHTRITFMQIDRLMSEFANHFLVISGI